MRAFLLSATLLLAAVPAIAADTGVAQRLHALFEAEWECGLREFHDVVLGSGAVPLDVLEANVLAWQARKAAAP